MKRLTIFSFYDQDGIADSYITILLQELKAISSNIIIVVNGIISDMGKEIFEKYTDCIIIRDNIGNDGGAYADVCVRYLGEDGLNEYDEIVFCNDTFFGPFISLKNVFQKMEKMDADFWGLNVIENGFWSFIESYFLVFRRQIIENGNLYTFCAKLCDEISKDPEYSYYAFELGIYHYLVNNKYNPGHYTNAQNASVYFDPDVCIQRYGLPVLKKKSFSPAMYEKDRQLFILKYIQEHYEYDIQNIINCVKRKYYININRDQIMNCRLVSCKSEVSSLYVPITKLTDAQIQDFLNTDSTVYIYGAGVFGKIIFYLYQDYIKKFGGFIVSDTNYKNDDKFCGMKVTKYSEIDRNASIIFGLNKAHTKEIVQKIGKRDNTLVLWQLEDS